MNAPAPLRLVTTAEQSLVGALLNDASGLLKVCQIAHVGDFGDPSCRTIFEAILACAQASEAVNPLTVAERLERLGRLDEVGGFAAVVDLQANTLPTHVESYARTVREHAKERTLERVGERLAEASRKPACSPSELALLAIETLKPIADQRERGAPLVAPIDFAAAEAQGKPPAREWWVDDWLMPGPTLLAAAGGMGKSLVMTMMGATLSLGRDYFAKCNGPRTVLYWACEDDADECLRRVWAAAEHLEIPISALTRFHVVSRVGLDNALIRYERGSPTFTPAFDQLRRQAEALQADVVILDNNAHTFGGNFMDRGEVTHFVSAVSGMHVDRKVATILLHHVARSTGSEFSDSAAWENAVRMRWWITDKAPDRAEDDEGEQRTTDSGVRYLARRKANYSGRDVRRLHFERGAMVAEQTEGGIVDVGLVQSIRARKAESVVLDGMARCKEMNVDVTDGQTSPGFLPKVLIEHKLADDLTKRELADAMRRLMGAGTIRRKVVGAYGNRSPKFGLVVSEEA